MARIEDEGGEAVDELRAFGLRYPGAHTKSPWPGHLDLAVKDKTFVYLSLAGEPLTISCKLPHSAEAALSLPFTTPTAYGLGKSGWVTATFPDGTPIPVDLLREWIDESYRAQAPKRLSAGLPPLGAAAGADTPLSLASSAAPGRARRSSVKQAAAAPAAEPKRARPKRTAAPAAPKRTAAPAAPERTAAKRTAASAAPKRTAAPAAAGRTAAAKRTAPKRTAAPAAAKSTATRAVSTRGAAAARERPAPAKKRAGGGTHAAARQRARARATAR